MSTKPLLKKPATTLLSPRTIEEEIKEPHTMQLKVEPSSLKRPLEVRPKKDLLIITRSSVSPVSHTTSYNNNKNNGQNKNYKY
jgi:hypothetical protein